MSLLVSSRRRIYVLLLFRERLTAVASNWGQSLAQIEGALGAALGPSRQDAKPPGARLAVSARVHRRWGGSIFGFAFFVIALEGAGVGS